MLKLLGERNRKKALRKALGDFTLPSFQAVTLQVLERIRNPASSASEVADLLALDPGLSVRVLTTANSAAYAPRQRIENLPQAIAMLGMSNLETLVLTIAIGSVLPRATCASFDSQRFWLAAARRATTAQALARLLHPAIRSESFTAGLLQDMAVPFFAAGRPEEYGPVLERWHAGEGSLPDLEQSVLGFDHAEVATWICAEWSLPESLCRAVGAHHQPPGSTEECPTAVALVSCLGETEEHPGLDDVVALAHECCGLSTEVVTELVQQSFESADELVPLFA